MAEYSIRHGETEDFGFICVQPPALWEISHAIEGLPGVTALCIGVVSADNPYARIQYRRGLFYAADVAIDKLGQIIEGEGHGVEVSAHKYCQDYREIAAA